MKLIQLLIATVLPALGRITAWNVVGNTYHEDGKVTREAEEAFANRYLLTKPGTDEETQVLIADAGDAPNGVMLDEASATEVTDADPKTVALLGAVKGTVPMRAGGTITAGDDVYGAADGEVTALPTSAGTYYRVGKAASDSTDGNPVEVAPCSPVKVVVVAALTSTNGTAAAASADLAALAAEAEKIGDDVRAIAAAITDSPAEVVVLSS